jgi:tRNA (adenine22-N1)-methyltransferase
LASDPSEYLRARVSERMLRIVDFVIDGRPTWDLCCDHGLIGMWAWHVRDLPELHFVDRAPGLIDELERRIRDHIEGDGLYFHACDATEIQIPAQPCNIIVAGIGFRASRRIFSHIDPSVAAHRLIASVHAEAERVPAHLQALGWNLTDEAIVEEDGRTRKITVWDGQVR